MELSPQYYFDSIAKFFASTKQGQIERFVIFPKLSSKSIMLEAFRVMYIHSNVVPETLYAFPTYVTTPIIHCWPTPPITAAGIIYRLVNNHRGRK